MEQPEKQLPDTTEQEQEPEQEVQKQQIELSRREWDNLEYMFIDGQIQKMDDVREKFSENFDIIFKEDELIDTGSVYMRGTQEIITGYHSGSFGGRRNIRETVNVAQNFGVWSAENIYADSDASNWFELSPEERERAIQQVEQFARTGERVEGAMGHTSKINLGFGTGTDRFVGYDYDTDFMWSEQSFTLNPATGEIDGSKEHYDKLNEMFEMQFEWQEIYEGLSDEEKEEYDKLSNEELTMTLEEQRLYNRMTDEEKALYDAQKGLALFNNVFIQNMVGMVDTLTDVAGKVRDTWRDVLRF